MRIASNTVSDTIITQIQQLSTQQSKLQSQVSSGLRITQPEDDPASFGRVMNLDSETRALGQYGANATAALQVSQATYSNLQQIKTISDRATQIGTLGTGTSGTDAMNAYASEVDQLIEQAVQQGNSQFNGNYLFAGTAVNTPPYTVTRNAAGQVTGVTYAGNTAQASIPLSKTASIAPGSDGTTNQGLGDFINHLVALRDALTAGNTSAVATAQSGLLTTENTMVNAIAEQGAVQMRITVSQAQQQTSLQDITKLASDETSADIPTTVVKLTQAQTAYQAALQSSANLMHTSLLDYLNTPL